MGIDRIPEAKCLRMKLKSIVDQKKSKSWNTDLCNQWVESDGDTDFYYIDGHVIVYSGSSANLGKKHVARQKLCLPGMQEFWVNNQDGLPYFFVTGQVNEKLLEMLSEQIVPKLLTEITPRYSQAELVNDSDLSRFTIVFDREGYSPKYFGQLWQQHRVAVLTYKKNVKTYWDISDFKTVKIEIDGLKEEMKLAEKIITADNVKMREIRKLSGDGHQTSIVTTNMKSDTENLAVKMFSRWSQENYFKYMRKEYDIDRMMQHLVEDADSDYVTANPIYSKLTHKLKKLREKIRRKEAKIYELTNKNVVEPLEKSPRYIKAQAKEQEDLDNLLIQEKALVEERSGHPVKIRIKDMPEELRYNRLHQESKHFQNLIKMICYRAETACANVLSEFYKRQFEERRELVKSIINTKGDIIVDDEKKTITVILYSLANRRMNVAAEQLCNILNDAEYCHPENNYRLIYKITK